MVNLFEIMRQAQSGSAMDNMARQFGLSVEQTQRALEALLPAFSLGLQRSAQNPNVFAQLLEMMSSGRYAPFFDGAAASMSPQAAGQQVLDKLFGPPDISRQIAAQASAATGIGAQVLQQMMPGLAATLMGGLFRNASVEGVAEFLRGWADWLGRVSPGGDPSSRVTQAASNLSQAWTDFMAAMLGGAGPAPRQREPAGSAAAPWAEFMRLASGGFTGAAAPPPPPPPPPTQPNPFAVLSQMFETGREAQTQHLANLQAIMQAAWVPKVSR